MKSINKRGRLQLLHKPSGVLPMMAHMKSLRPKGEPLQYAGKIKEKEFLELKLMTGTQGKSVIYRYLQGILAKYSVLNISFSNARCSSVIFFNFINNDYNHNVTIYLYSAYSLRVHKRFTLIGN